MACSYEYTILRLVAAAAAAAAAAASSRRREEHCVDDVNDAVGALDVGGDDHRHPVERDLAAAAVDGHGDGVPLERAHGHAVAQVTGVDGAGVDMVRQHLGERGFVGEQRRQIHARALRRGEGLVDTALSHAVIPNRDEALTCAAAKASFVGAKTVKGPGPPRVPASPAAVTAVTSVLKVSGMDTAVSTIDIAAAPPPPPAAGGRSTALMT